MYHLTQGAHVVCRDPIEQNSNLLQAWGGLKQERAKKSRKEGRKKRGGIIIKK